MTKDEASDIVHEAIEKMRDNIEKYWLRCQFIYMIADEWKEDVYWSVSTECLLSEVYCFKQYCNDKLSLK